MKLPLPSANNVRVRKSGARALRRVPRAGAKQAINGASSAPTSLVASTGGQRAASKDAWRPIATFVIEFELYGSDRAPTERRTRAHHHEAMRDKTWPGFVPDELCEWIADQLQSEIDAAYARQVRTTQQRAQDQASAAVLDWQIGSVRLLRAGTDPRGATLYDHGSCTSALLVADSPFVIELDLERSAATGAVLQASSFCVRAHNRDTRRSIELGTIPVIAADQAPHKTVSLNVGSLASTGSYRLECVPLVGERAIDAAALSVPLLQVVECAHRQ